MSVTPTPPQPPTNPLASVASDLALQDSDLALAALSISRSNTALQALRTETEAITRLSASRAGLTDLSGEVQATRDGVIAGETADVDAIEHEIRSGSLLGRPNLDNDSREFLQSRGINADQHAEEILRDLREYRQDVVSGVADNAGLQQRIADELGAQGLAGPLREQAGVSIETLSDFDAGLQAIDRNIAQIDRQIGASAENLQIAADLLQQDAQRLGSLPNQAQFENVQQLERLGAQAATIQTEVGRLNADPGRANVEALNQAIRQSGSALNQINAQFSAELTPAQEREVQAELAAARLSLGSASPAQAHPTLSPPREGRLYV